MTQITCEQALQGIRYIIEMHTEEYVQQRINAVINGLHLVLGDVHDLQQPWLLKRRTLTANRMEVLQTQLALICHYLTEATRSWGIRQRRCLFSAQHELMKLIGMYEPRWIQLPHGSAREARKEATHKGKAIGTLLYQASRVMKELIDADLLKLCALPHTSYPIAT